NTTPAAAEIEMIMKGKSNAKELTIRPLTNHFANLEGTLSMCKFKKAAIAAVLLAGISSSVFAAGGDKVQAVESFKGGFEVWTIWGYYCIMDARDTGANLLYSQAIAAKANNWDTALYSAGRAGWGYDSTYGYGNQACVAIYTQDP